MAAAPRSAASRARILDAASRAFRAHGYAATRIDAIMSAAGMTHGGFYAHFPSKAALLEATLVQLNEPQRSPLFGDIVALSGRRLVAAIIDRYLSRRHRDQPEAGCPLPTLGAELPRVPGNPSEALAAKARHLAALLADHLPGDGATARERAQALVALLVGGIVTARTLPENHAEAWLRSCRRMARTGAGLAQEDG